MNSAVKSIFNEKVTEKWNLWIYEQCMGALFTVEKLTKEKEWQWQWRGKKEKVPVYAVDHLKVPVQIALSL